MVDEAQQDQERDGEEEAQGGRDPGAFLVGPVSEERREE